MYVSHGRQLIYVRVPRTGSTWFLRHNRDLVHLSSGVDHETVWEAMSRDVWQEVSHYKRIGFVRQPLSWIPSFCYMCAQERRNWERYISDTEPYSRATGCTDRFLSNLKMTPFDWFTNPETGEVLVDTIYRTEDLHEMFPVNPEIRWKRENRRPSGDQYDLEFSDEGLAMMKDRFARELEYYK